MQKLNKNLTEGKTGHQLMKLTWPMLLGLMGMVIFNLADTYFLGQLGVRQLAAIGFCFPVIMFVNSLSQGIGIGTSSLISRNIVNSERHKVRMMASRAIVLGIAVVMFFAILGILTINPLFKALGAGSELMKDIHDYMSIWYTGVIFVVVPMIGNNIVRATGDTFTPGMLMVVSAVINIILDPLLIFGIGPFPEMGMKGAALATVIARGFSFAFILIVLIKRENLLTIRSGRLKEIIRTWKHVLYVALPASLALLITPVSTGLITRILASFGKEAVAAFGVASRIEMFVLMMIAALGSVLIIFVGQNISSYKFSRIAKALKYSGQFSIIWGFSSFLIFLLFAENISSVFSNDPTVIDITSRYLIIVSLSYGFQGLVMLSMSSFNGLNKPLPATFFSLLRMMVIYVPFAWLGSIIFGLNGIFWSANIANVIAGISAFVYIHRLLKKTEAKLESNQIKYR